MHYLFFVLNFFVEEVIMLKYSFAPIADSSCRVLILGSMPGEESLRLQQYYGHSRNAFWRIIDDELPCKIYVQKCSYLLQHKIALWDVLQSAERKGSLDSAIKNERPNELDKFLKQYKNITHIFFNGGKAKNSFSKYFKDLYLEYNCTQLPSTSPAYTISFEKKKKLWHEALGKFL